MFSAGVAFGQASSYPLFEHFTQASCGPCAAQNPAFQSGIMVPYAGQVNHIAYHTSWPGTDPMYTFNASENGAMTSYYGVSGVPNMIMDGVNQGSPTAITTDMVDNAKAISSPVKLRVTDTDLGGGNHSVDVDVITTGNITGTNRLFVAVVEAEIIYGTPPGSNGETEFPNVFRDMLTSTTGDAYSPAACGSATSFNYTYTEDPAYDMNEIYVVAWIANASTKAVLNSGSSRDVPWYSMGCEAGMEDGAPSTLNDFDLDLYNTGSVAEQYRITLTHNAPAGWATGFDVQSGTYTTTADITIAAGTSETITLNVTPDATPAWGEFQFEIESLDNPGDPHEFMGYTVVSGITDLIVNNDQGWGDGNTYDWSQDYVDGLTAAGNTSFAETTTSKFANAWNSGAAQNILNIYWNISWTFPGLTDLGVDAMEPFLDAGGNLFISGQDLGWDTYNNLGTANTQSFYTNYLSANFVSDGAASDNMLNWNTSDAIFGTETNSSIVDAYGGGNIYPENITPISPATSIFTYNSGNTGGIRVEENGHKVVYIGVDTRMISNTAVRDRVIWVSHDWFYGILTGVEMEEEIATAMGQNYPNPSNDMTIIPFTDLNMDVTLRVMDLTGRVVLEAPVAAGTTQFEIATSELSNGAYQYAIFGEDGSMSVKTMEVIR